MSSEASVVKTINRGAIIESFPVAGQNVLLGFPDPSLFDTIPHPHFGQTIGRTTNRIANAKLTNLNGKEYTLNANNGPNNLHGGNVGWGARQWDGPFYVKKGQWDEGIKEVKPAGWNDNTQGEGRQGWGYSLKSADGEEGFPGAVEATVHYFEGRGQNGELVLDADYELKWQENDNSGAQETVVGITNHAYFNLNLVQQKTASLVDHTASLATGVYQKLIEGSGGIPDGSFTNHPEVPAEPNTKFFLGTDSGVRPIDDCFIVERDPKSIPLDTRSQPLKTLATLHGDASGLNVKVQSTEPAFQFYTGGFIDVPAWSAGEAEGRKWEGGEGYKQHAGVCVEPSRYVNAAGNEDWKGMCLLKKGDVFGCRSRYWGWKD